MTFDTDRGLVRALDGDSFDVNRGETVCLVGESGSGKTVACESLTRLVPTPPARLSGTVTFDGTDLLSVGNGDTRADGDRVTGAKFRLPRAALFRAQIYFISVPSYTKVEIGVEKREQRQYDRNSTNDG
ncbi:hypothetical protein BG842_26390 [Haladaptatus sp. W1]|uniref:ATP-binding cassette domain-containing protein n=1 Tax=Haladaptatus sp. W1 TaxID=1897478 RepID=UPI0008497212|nr:ATP-binding cassette domain-containing protein [Haladaptatus sp. W1]ODR81821.1 hypothetical protein BG842_26390 [Haladaptatus sp. W1]